MASKKLGSKPDEDYDIEDDDDDDYDEDYDDDDDDDYDEGSGKKKVIISIIFIGIIVALVLILVYNVGGIRDKYFRPALEKIPIIKNLLPPIEEGSDTSEFSNMSKEELISLVTSLNQDLSKADEEKKALNQAIDEQNSEMTRLKELEAAQVKFKQEKEEFDKLIALNDPDAYSKFYESISPENASSIYEESVKKNQLTKEFKDYAKTFESMKKDSAAKILEELISSSDIELAVSILQNITSKQRADILSAMSSENAAICTKMLAP